jgi:hypothetical protein
MAVCALALLLAAQVSTIHCRGLSSPVLLRGSDKQEPPRSLVEISLPSIQHPFMQLVNASEGNVTVKLSQSLLFDETKCGSNARYLVDFVLLTFAVYQKPNDAEKKCEVHLKKDACWSTNIVVACDPATNQATVDLYTRDTYHLDKLEDIVENPKVAHEFGMCIGPMDYIRHAVHHTGTFNCAAPAPTKHDIYGE